MMTAVLRLLSRSLVVALASAGAFAMSAALQDPQQAAQAELLPGVLPADVSATAKASWEALCAALGAPPGAERVQAFDLSFDARVWQEGGEGEKSFRNGQLRFLAPGFVDSALESGRRRMRGPRGDWVVDSKGGAVRLQGVEMAQDRRELDQVVHIARTFANLVNARSLRLRKLEPVATPPFRLPAAVAERATAASWLSIVSPDFTIARQDGSAGQGEVRVWLALDATTHLPLLAVVAEESSAGPAPLSALLVEMWNWAPLDGLRAPKNVRTYPPLHESPSWAFQERQNLQLWLTKGTLRAKLAPTDFEPPRK